MQIKPTHLSDSALRLTRNISEQKSITILDIQQHWEDTKAISLPFLRNHLQHIE
jgi:hypothetical protein